METAPATTPPSKRSSREDALAVVRRLREAGHVAYFAGGCVRDMLRGREPKDYDVATDAPPNRVRQLFTNTQAVGAAFGVILVRQRRSQIEVATFRADGRYLDGRRPEEVTFTTAEEDAKRRDFTINGLFVDPIEERVIDYVGGQEDLKNRVLRAIGNANERFEEDHLRLLRAVRFASRFGFDIEGRTRAAIVHRAEQLKRISPERVAEELRLMLTSPARAAAWRLLWDCELVHVVFRFLGTERPQRLDAERDVVSPLEPASRVSFGTALAAALLTYRWHLAARSCYPFELIDAGFIVAAGKAMRQALKISNEELDELTGILRDLRALFAPDRPTTAQMKRFLAGQTARQTRQLIRALRAVPARDWRHVVSTELRLSALEQQEEIAPAPLVTGDDLTAAGLQPGPVFKRVLDAVYDAQLEDRVRTKEEALELALRLAAEKS